MKDQKFNVGDKVRLHNHPYDGLTDIGKVISIIPNDEYGVLYEVFVSYTNEDLNKLAAGRNGDGSKLVFIEEELTKINQDEK